MIEVVYYVAASLDGFIATPDGSVDWLAPFEFTGEDYGYADFYASVDIVLMGRRTYEQCLTFASWPYAGKPCVVFSRRDLGPGHPDMTLQADDPAAAVAELKRRGLTRTWLVGGGALAASFRAEGLITEYVVSVMPVVLGAGFPLIAGGGGAQRLTLSSSRAYPGGVVQSRYRPA